MNAIDPIKDFLTGKDKDPPIDELQKRHAEATQALAEARKAYSEAALKAQTGGQAERKALEKAREALNAAVAAEADIAVALEAAQNLATQRAQEAREKEVDKKWALGAKHLAERQKAAEDVVKYVGWLADAWKRLEKATGNARHVLPQRFGAGEICDAAYLVNAMKLEFTRQGLDEFGERWIGGKTPPALLAQIEQANAHALKGRGK
jgi:hypothetical protein